MDCCHSASGTRSQIDSPNAVRFSQPPSNFKVQENLDQEIWSLFPSNSGLRSHVLLSACSSSGPAWEFKGRGVFTVALLALLTDYRTNKLRYCDIAMLMDIPAEYVYNPSMRYSHVDTLTASIKVPIAKG